MRSAAAGTVHLHEPPRGLARARASHIERWFATMGAAPPLDLARSGAPARSVGELLVLGGEDDLNEYLSMSLEYDAGCGSSRLRRAVAAVTGCHAHEVLVTHGAVEGLLLACSAVVGERRDVLVAWPAYEGLLRAVEAAGGTPRPVPVWAAGSDRLGVRALGDADLGQCAAVVLNSPHNPTGLRAAPSELEMLSERCAGYGTALIVDQVSTGTLDRNAPSLGHLLRHDSRTVLVGDLSKAFGLGGLRVGWCTTRNPSLLERMAQLRDVTSLSNSVPAQLLATIALEHRDALTIAPLARRNLGRLERFVASTFGGRWIEPQDGLVAFCRLPISDSFAFADDLRRSRGVSVTPGSFFGHRDHVRIGLGVSEEHFEEALLRIGEALRCSDA